MASLDMVSSYHNRDGDVAPGLEYTFLIDGQLLTRNQLLNSSFTNEEVRKLLSSEVLIGAFHHFTTENGITVIQCLKQITFS